MVTDAKVVSMDTDMFLWTQAKATAEAMFAGFTPCLVYLSIVDKA